MAGAGLCVPLVNGATMRLPAGCVFRPTEGELVMHYLYRRAVNMPLPCDFITDVDILRHNPWDVVPGAVTDKEKGKYFFTRKEIKYPGSRRSNRVTSNGFWRSAGSEKPVYYNPGGGGDVVLVGMRRTLTFHYGNSRTAQPTKWGMSEFRLAGSGLLPCPVTSRATGDVPKPPCSCTEATIAKRNDGLPAVLRHGLAPAPPVNTVIEPDGSWLICRIYKKRQRAPRVVVPPATGNNAEEIIAPPANDHEREGQVQLVDFLRQAPRPDPSSPCSCIMGPILQEGSDESAGGSDEKDREGNGGGK